MTLSRLRSDLVRSDEGWTVRTVGRDEARYTDDRGEVVVEVEHAVSDVPDRAFWYIHRGLVTRLEEDGARTRVVGEDAALVLDRVVRALDLLGVDTELV